LHSESENSNCNNQRQQHLGLHIIGIYSVVPRLKNMPFYSHKHSHFYFIKQIHKRNRQTVGQCSFAFHSGRRSCTGPPFVCFVYVFVWWNKNDCAYDLWT